MTRQETLGIMGILRAAYPSYYRDMKRSEAEGIVSLWSEMFQDDSPQVVALAVKALIAEDAKGYPPHIGAVKAKMKDVAASLGIGPQVVRAEDVDAFFHWASRELGPGRQAQALSEAQP